MERNWRFYVGHGTLRKIPQTQFCMKFPDFNEQFLTLPEVAKAKNVSRQAVYDAIKAGKLTCYIVLGRRAIKKSDLRSWHVTGRRAGGPLSAAHKAKIAESQKRRWAKTNSQ